MRTVAQPVCPVCGSEGCEAYPALRDRLFGAPGTWRMSRCVNSKCGVFWLDPAPLGDDLPVAYRGYYTHSQPDERGRKTGFRADVQQAFLAHHLGSATRNDSAPPPAS